MTSSSPQADTVLNAHVFDLCAPERVFFNTESALDGTMTNLKLYATIPPEFQWAGSVFYWRNGTNQGNISNQVTVTGTNMVVDLPGEIMELGDEIELRVWIVSPCGNFPIPEGTFVDFDFVWELAEDPGQCFAVDAATAQLTTEAPAILPAWNPASPQVAPGECFTWTAEVANEGFGDAYGVNGQFTIGPALSFNAITAIRVSGAASTNVIYTAVTNANGSVTVTFNTDEVIPGASAEANPNNRKIEFDLEVCALNCDVAGMTGELNAEAGCFGRLCDSASSEASIVLAYDQPLLVEDVTFRSEDGDGHCSASYPHRYSVCKPLQISSVLSNDSTVVATNVSYTWRMWAVNSQNQFLDNVSVVGSDPGMNITVTTQTFADEGANEMVSNGYGNEIYLITYTVDRIEPREFVTIFAEQVPTCPFDFANDVTSSNYLRSWWGHNSRRTDRFISWRDSCGLLIEDDHLTDDIEQWRSLMEFPHVSSAKVQGTPILGAGECGVIQPSFQVPWWAIVEHCDEGVSVRFTLPPTLEWGGSDIIMSNENLSVMVTNMAEGVDFTYDPITRTFDIPINDALRAYGYCATPFYNLTIPICVADPCIGGLYEIPIEWFGGTCCGCEYRIAVETMPITVVCPGCACGVAAGEIITERPVNGVLQQADKGLPGDLLTYTDSFTISGGNDTCCLTNMTWRHQSWSLIGDARANYDDPVLVYQPGSTMITITRANGTVENYSFDASCFNNAPAHPDDGDGDGTGDASGYCDWDFGAQGITLCGGDQVTVKFDAQVNCYGVTPANENILDWAFSLTSGFDKDVAGRSCGPNAHFYDLVKYWLSTWQPYFSENGTGAWVGTDGVPTETCQRKQYMVARYVQTDDEPSDPFPDEDRLYLTNAVLTVNLSPGLVYDPDPDSYIWIWTRTTGWQQPTVRITPVITTHPAGGQTLTWDLDNLTDTNGMPVVYNRSEAHNVRVYYAVRPLCDFQQGPCVDLNGDGDCGDLNTIWELYDSCGRLRSSDLTGGRNLNWDATLNNARGDLTSTMSPVLQNSSTRDLNCWTLQINNVGNGTAWNTWTYLDIADDIVIDTITDLDTGLPLPVWYVTNDANDVYLELGDLETFTGRGLLRICGHLEDTNGDGDACDTGFFGQERGVTATTSWGCEYSDAPPDIEGLEICETVESEVTIRLLPANLQVEKSINNGEPIALCEEFPNTIRMLNTGFTDGFNLRIIDLPPPGVFIDTNSVVMWLTDANGVRTQITACATAPTQLSTFGTGVNERQLIRWDVCPNVVLPRGGVFEIDYLAQTTCEFISGRPSRVFPSFEAPCGQRVFLPNDYISPVSVLAGNQNADFSDFEVAISPINGDGCGVGDVSVSFVNMPGAFPGGNPANNLQIVQVLPPGIHYLPGSISVGPIGGGTVTNEPTAYCVEWDVDGNPVFSHNGELIELRTGIVAGQEVLIFDMDDLEPGEAGSLFYQFRADANCVADGRVHYSLIRYNSPMECPGVAGGTCAEIQFENQRSVPLFERRAVVPVVETHDAEILCLGEQIEFTINAQNTGNGWADNFSMFHSYDPTIMTPVAISDGGIATNFGLIEWVSGLTSLSDTDGDGLADELAPGAPIKTDGTPLTVVFEFTGPLGCNTHRVTTNRSFAAWGCDNQPSITGCPAPAGSEGGKVCGIPDAIVEPTDLLCPDLSLEKTTQGVDADLFEDAPAILVGDTVVWVYAISNSGNTAMHNFSVVDSEEGNVTCAEGAIPVLQPGEVFYCTLEAPQVCGAYDNLATVTGTPVLSDCERTAEDPSHYFGVCPGIDLEKSTQSIDADSPTGPYVEIGDPVVWTYELENYGNVALNVTSLVDNVLGVITIPAAPFGDNDGDGLLDPTEIWTIAVTGTATTVGQYMNTADVLADPVEEDGTPYGFPPVTDGDPSHYFGAQPGIDIEKFTNGQQADSPTGPVIEAGDPVHWTYTVSNLGNVPLAGVLTTVIDSNEGTANYVSGDTDADSLLDINEVWTFEIYGVATAGPYSNNVDVVGIPTDENGNPVPDSTPVTDADPSHYFGADPDIDLQKTVYYGHDGGASCPGDELESNIAGAPVTYCFVITNTGNTYLSPITLNDPALGFSTTLNVLLAPGGSVTTHLESTISGDLLNTAEVSGNPTDENGNDYPDVDDPTDEDTAEVEEITPGIQILKTDYAGHDGGASCPGGELTFGVSGADVTYCFQIINTGNTYLVDIIVTDNDISPPYTGTIAGPIAPGETVMLFTERSVSGDLINTASVTGDPSDDNGDPYDDVEDVTDEDDAEVEQVAPAILLDKTVYAGHDGGASCFGQQMVTGVPGTEVTYCFTVFNEGDTHLDNITLTDNNLSPVFNHTFVVNLAPGDSVTTYVETTITGDLVNTADVTGNPTDEDGNDLPDIDNVDDQDDAEVIELVPGIGIEKTVYFGHDGGASCAGDELEINLPNAPVTYCFVVTNSGQTYLSDINVSDPLLGFSTNLYVNPTPSLPPGGSFTIFMEAQIDGDLVNTASTTGTPSDSIGDPLPGAEDITDDDDAEVDEVQPGIQLIKTGYNGHDTGASCPGTDLSFGAVGDDVTYCFELINTGNTYLVDIDVTDNDITPNFNQTVPGPIAPGERVFLHVETMMLADFTNTASVTAAPSDEDGDPIDDIDEVTDDDPAEVDVVAPSIAVQKTVYNGHDSGTSCGGVEAITNLYAADVTYCFVVQNTGDTYLDNITVSDFDVSPIFTHVFTGVNLAPGGTVTTYVERVILGDLQNTADVSGNPTDENGDDLPEVDEVTDTDPASVDMVEPSLELMKTVYIGHDGGASCPGTDYELNVPGQQVTYCFEVINTGDTWLNPVIVNDPALSYTSANLGNLAPGASVTVHVETVMSADLTNVADAVGNPANPDGSDIPDMDDVTDDDPAEVDVETPAIDLSKTVYSGWNAGGCPGVELLQGLIGEQITYCFIVSNSGTAFLTDVTVTDNLISPPFSQTLTGVLAPGETRVLFTQTTLQSDLVNTAEVTGTMSDGSGNPVEDPSGNPITVSDDDPAEVDLVSPGIAVSKTVYEGHDGGASCEGQELLVDTNGTPVTYCFVIENTGDTYLDNVTVNDPALGYSNTFSGVNLAPGGRLTNHIEVALLADLLNIAAVSGNPTDEDGNDLTNVVDVTDDDPAEVEEVRVGIDLQKTVYAGWDNGIMCPSAGDLQYGLNGDEITYCFKITNTGNTYIVNAMVTDNDITPNYSGVVPGPIPPGGIAYLHVETSLMGDLVNTASVVGAASDGDGNEYPDIPPLSDEDPAEVDEVAPAISVSKTVYNGHDGGTSCAGVQTVTNLPNADVTYCFVVENTGDTFLDTITVIDADISPTFTHVFAGLNLAPGGMATTFVERVIDGDLENTADVSGNPTDENGDDLEDVDDVTDEDPAYVDEVTPGIDLLKTVYIGHDGGASCPGSDYELNVPGQQVTYCFEVINTGDTFLNPVILDDPALGFTSANLGNLAPGASLTVHVETVMSGNLTNVAEAVGTPANPDGSEIPDMDDVVDDDPAEVDVENPAITISKTVHSGWNVGGCPGVELLQGLNGEPITYCFIVSNSGTAFLTDVVVTDTMVSPPFSQTLSGTLAPGESVVLFTQTTLQSDLVNTAEVVATMSDEDGNPVNDPSGDPITVADDDPAEVDLVGPGIELNKSVYDAHDGGASCPGQALLVDTNGTPITYCFVVQNTGDTHLDNITILDPALSYTHTFTGVNLAPGGILTNHIETSLLSDWINFANVSGNPTDENGDDLPNVDDVTDDDMAQVEQVRPGFELEKTVYAGHNGGLSCPTGIERVNGVNGDDITYCFQLVNTGNTYLVNLTVTDTDITPNYSGVVPGPIAPGGVAWLFTEVQLNGDLVNTASATATPSDDEGEPYDDIPSLTDEDDAEVDQHTPSMQLLKTVYNGHDAGASCATGVDAVTNTHLAAVTYCFTVVNTGDTHLDSITVTDTDLSPSFSHTFAGLNLAPGGSATTHVETVIDGDLMNTADASGNPTDENGDDLEDLDEVTDEDTADVDEIEPSIELLKTVYHGHDGGLSCAGNERHVNVLGTPVTYCFVVVNTGDTWLDSITVVDQDLTPAFTNVFTGLHLAPGGSVTTHTETVLSSALINVADASGNPTTESGEDIPDTPDATDDDTAEVEPVAPAISLEKTVYAGHNNGIGCPNAGELAYSTAGGPVTYCFLVTNTGDTHLNLATVVDNDITPAFIGQVPYVLAPNQSAWLHAERTATADFTNTASVSGTPSDPDGNTLPNVPEPTDEDTSEVDVVAPGLELAKTVYLGHNGGASCATAGEAVTNANGAAVTFCFVVSNTGDTWLDTITITDNDLSPSFSQTFVGLNLAPGGSVTTHTESAINGDFINTADASGNPTDENGDDMPALDDVTDDDPAEVDAVTPAIELAKTVYFGHDGGTSCPGTDLHVNVVGSAVTYCFEVINTGDTVLNPVTLQDPAIPGFASMVMPATTAGPLAPGDSAWFHVESTITSDLLNTASANGDPANPDGSDIPGMDDVTDDDPAEVETVAPSIDVQKTVYAGHNNGLTCPNAVEHLDTLAGEAITYCFHVTNTGNSPLVNVTVNDALMIPAYNDLFPFVLLPGQSIWFHAERTATGTYTNIADVTGTPSDPSGDPLPEVDDVTDEDDADIAVYAPSVNLQKTVYNGHDGGASCDAGVESVSNLNGAPVTYCFVVENTGDTWLDTITITDTDLVPNFSHTFALNLAPGGSVTTHTETVINGDLVNTADVTSNPTDEDGNDLPNLDDVGDDDSAEVDEVSPGIELAKTVYIGHDDGASCPGSESEINLPGALVTYCFEVVNTGDTMLDPVIVTDLELDPNFFSLNLGPLAPGQSATTHHQTVISGDLMNIAEVSGTPTNPDGSDIPEVDDVVDDDTTSVDEQTPSVDLQKSVYLGWNSGGGCPGVERISGNPGDPITYCFQVTNDGDANLVNVTVTDSDVVPPYSEVIPFLAPGDSVTLHIQRTLSEDILNTAGVDGTMADENGDPVTDENGDPITTDDEDTAEVDVKAPAIQISKTVYEGHNNGASCEGVDDLLVNVGAPVTWCFLVENTGDSHLGNVTITDTDLDPPVTITVLGILAPGATITAIVERTASSVMNTAGVTGTPVDENGTPLPDVDPPSDDDPAELRAEDFDLALEKTLASEGPFAPGDPVTFTVTVRNEGTVAAQNVLIEDRPPAGLVLADPAWTSNGSTATRLVAGPIAPGGQESYSIRFIIADNAAGTLENRAEIAAAEDTSGTPRDDIDSTADSNPGDPESEDDEDGDSLNVERFDLALTKELTSAGPFAPGDSVTFSILVTNQGTVAAQDIQLMDTIPDGLSLTDPNWTDLGDTAVGMLAGPLAPGAAVIVTITFTIDADASGRMANVAEITRASGPDGEPRDDIDSTPDGDPSNDGAVTDNATDNENGDEDDHDIANIDIDVFDLALVKVLSSPGPFSPGDDMTFTMYVFNQGDVVATNVELSDYIPAGLSLNDSAWTNNAGIATSLIAGPIAPATSASIDITFTIDAGFSGAGENAAEISSASDEDGMPRADIDSTADNDPTNDGPVEDGALDGQNGDEDDHDSEPFAVGLFDLALQKRVLGTGPWEPGDSVSFRLTVHNQGGVNAQSILLRDTLPAGLTLIDPDWTDNGDGTASRLLGGPIVPGANLSVDILFTIDDGVSGAIENVAEIEAAQDSEGNPRDDVDGSFDADPDNDGPVTDDDINGSGEGSSDEDNHDPATITVDAFDLALVKTLESTGPFTAGDSITFGLTVINQGNVPAFNVQVVDYLPTGLTLNDSDWQSLGAAGASRFLSGPIQPGASETLTLTTLIDAGMSGSLENSAEIAQAEDESGELRDDIDSRADTNPANDGPVTDDAVDGENGDEDDSDIAVVNLDVFDLALTKAVAGPGPYASGDLVTYTITVINQGTLAASQIQVVDYLPPTLALEDPDWTSATGNTAVFLIEGPIAPGEAVEVPVTMKIIANLTGEIVNEAEITSALDTEGNARPDIDSVYDGDPENDGPSVDDDIVGTNGDEDDHDPATLNVEPFDLALRKTLTGQGPFFVGDTVTYNVTVYNQGAITATGIMVTDHLPAGLSLADNDWTPGANNTATRTIAGPITPGAEASVTITCTILPGSEGELENIAEITAGHDADGNPQTDIDSSPDADPTNDGVMVDDEIDNGGNDEDDHDLAMLPITPLGSIGTTVWIDLSNDGDPSNEQLSELGLAGVEVTLYDVVNGVSNIIGVATTSPTGEFFFDELPPGDYLVEVNLDDISENLSILTTPASYELTLNPGESVSDANFGFNMPPTAVEIEFFTAKLTAQGVALEWRVGFESGTLGYNLYRIDPEGPTKINEVLVLANGNGYQFDDPNGVGGIYLLEELTDNLRTEVVAEALTHKLAPPVAGETLMLAVAEDGTIELTTNAKHPNLLLTGFDTHPRVIDETNPDRLVELIGERLETETDKGMYLSVEPDREIIAVEGNE